MLSTTGSHIYFKAISLIASASNSVRHGLSCVLCESVCDRTETLMLRKDNTSRKILLEIIITWIQTPDPNLDVQYELNMACLRTIIKLLDRLQLDSPEAANDLGPPLEPPKPSMQYSKEHRLYKDLMARQKDKSTDAVQHIFVSTDLSSDPHDPVYFMLRSNKIDVEALDLELLMYHMFKLLLSPEYQDAYVEMVVDCTDLTSISELPIPWKMSRTHILNPNMLTQKYLRRLQFLFWQSKDISDLLPHVPATVIESPALNDPLSLEKEPSNLFAEVTMKIDQNRVPINLTIGITHRRITSIRAVNVSPEIACKSTDIILLADFHVFRGWLVNAFSTKDKNDAWVYVLVSNNGQACKIGCTRRTPELRLTEWRRKHTLKEFKLVYSIAVNVNVMFDVEREAHHQILNYADKIEGRCPDCPIEHREEFVFKPGFSWINARDAVENAKKIVG
ncbi:hypothetical protein K435DRAFT_864784 [Dendrothele bispora CBS 962.96]|uniref:Bacteriophage T5 Orf172 DNA-binding domain-containing protein n=1 Tax=Dendrothele bispora (strain CBS 962.96) TaxID=1314807 RepID=A0A4S8LL53_DENBC|nr:hypothetical protein K435DRAFT_864784 [Dendrothele bispora CBS 962.96]